MSDSPGDWYQARNAYYTHHRACPACIGAGIATATPRCTVGLELWQSYQAAGTPPHFMWLNTQDLKAWKFTSPNPAFPNQKASHYE